MILRWVTYVACSLAIVCFFTLDTKAAIPSFSARRDYHTPYSTFVASGDVNSDGIPDLVSSGSGLAVQLGNGDGTFRAGPVTQMSYTAGTVILADVNHDGKLDALFGAGGLNSSGFGVALGKGDGTFGSPLFYSTGAEYTGQDLAVGDFNGDGVLDSATVGSSGAWVFMGMGDGTFSPGVLFPFAHALIDQLCCLSAADVDGDGNLDLVAGWNTGIVGGYAILFGDGNGQFEPAIEYQTPAIPYNFALADLNHDQRLDIIVISDFFKGYAYVQLGNGDGTFATGKWTYLPGGEFIAVGDLNGDGNPDLVSNYGYIAYGHGDGTFQQATYTPDGNALLNGDSSKILLVDLRGKGLPDIVVANFFDTLSVLLNKGNGSFKDGFIMF